MDHDIPITGWQADWVARDFPALWGYTLGLTYALTGSSIVLGVRTLLRQRRTHRALSAARGADRAAILAEHERHMQRSGRQNFAIALVFLAHAVLIWLVDAGISVSALSHDAAALPWSTSPSFLLTLAAVIVSVVGLLLAAFVALPLAQIALVAWLLARKFPADGSGARRSLADYVPEARIVTTYMAQMWLMLEFFIVAWWPLELHSTPRMMLLMAVCGSGSVWLDASLAFNFCADRLAEVQLTGLSGGVGELVRMFGRQVVAVHSFSKSDADKLPTYVTVTQVEEYSEKEVV